MSNNTELILGLSCLIPTLYCFFVLKKIETSYRLFFFVILSDVVIELVNVVIKKVFFIRIPIVFFNCYLLINFFFFLHFVSYNKYIKKNLGILLFIVSIIIFIANGFYEVSINKFYFFFLCFTSMVMLFVSIKILSAQIFETNKKLFKNFWFLFSCGAVLYHSFTLLIFGLYYFSLFKTPNGRSVVYIHHFVNVAYYLILTWAIYYIPKSNNKMANKNV